jgi:hypothetical protein
MFAAVVVTPIQSHAQDALRIAPSGNIGLGIDSPERQLHLRGSNAAFRMDRNVDGASFFLVRTSNTWIPWKTFQVGVTSSGPNNGQFIINDLGQAVGGTGVNRMKITNNGEVHFAGTVRAPAFVTTSSARYKQDIEPLRDTGSALQRLHGVRFTWKDSGQASLGLIAEEVAAVFPEVVERDADGQAAGVNYSALVAVLVEAVKDQQAQLEVQDAKLAAYRAEVAAQQVRVAGLESRLAEFETLEVRLNQIEGLLLEQEPRMAAMPRP